MASANYGIGHLGFKTVEVDDGNFDYHDQVMVEDSQVRSKDFWIRPIGGVVNQSGPFYFTIEPTDDQYLQLNNARLEVVASLERGDGSRCHGFLDVVAPVNMLGAVMWSSIEMHINGQPLSGSSSVNMGYKAFINAMLSNDTDALNTHLVTCLTHMDTPGAFGNFHAATDSLKTMFIRGVDDGRIIWPGFPQDIRDMLPLGQQRGAGDRLMDADEYAEEELRRKIAQKEFMDQFFADEMGIGVERRLSRRATNRDPFLPVNKGFDTRYMIAADSETFTMVSPLAHDFFTLNNHIGPGNKIDLKLTKHSDPFLLNTYMMHRGYRLKLHDMKLHCHTIYRRERIHHPLVENYRMTETHLHKQVVPAMLSQYSFRMFNPGVQPKTIILAMVPTAAAEGSYALNPFNFHHFGLTKLSLMVDGEETPQGGLTFDFAKRNQDVQRGYWWLYANTGALNGQRGNLISLSAFQAGATIIAVDLTPDRCNGMHNHNAQTGYIDCNLSFAEPLDTSITVLYELAFNKVVVNDKSRGTLAVLDVAV